MKLESDPKDGFWFHVLMMFSSNLKLEMMFADAFHIFLGWAETTNSHKWLSFVFFKVAEIQDRIYGQRLHPTYGRSQQSRRMPFAPSNDEGSKSRSFHPEGMESMEGIWLKSRGSPKFTEYSRVIFSDYSPFNFKNHCLGVYPNFPFFLKQTHISICDNLQNMVKKVVKRS